MGYFAAAFSALTLVIAAAPSLAQTWQPLGDTVHTGRVMNPTIADGERGILLCTFQDGALQGRGSVRAFDPLLGQWVLAGEEGESSAGRDWWPRLAFGHFGEIYRVNYDYGLGGRLGFRVLDVNRFNELIWSAPLGGSVSTGQAHTPDIVVDRWGRPTICFEDGPGGNLPTQPQGGITVLRIDPASGQVVALGGAGFSDAFMPAGRRSRTWHTQIEEASDGTLYAAWTEKGLDPHRKRIYVARYDEGLAAWGLIGEPGLGLAGQGAHLAMALDPSGVPVIVYRSEWPRGLRAVRWIPGTRDWEQIGSDFATEELQAQTGYVGFSSNGGYRESVPLTIDGAGRIIVACRAHDPVGDLRMKTWTYDPVSGWTPLGSNGGFLPGVGEEDYGFLITARGGVPVMSCRRLPDVAGEHLVVHAFH